MELRPGDRVLDVGAGTGVFTTELAHDPCGDRVVSHFSSIALPGGGAGRALPLLDAR